MNKSLVNWYCKKFIKIYIKLHLKKPLTKKEKYLYDILDEYDFYAPKKYHDHKNLT